MTYKDRYRLIYTLLLTALLAGGRITAMAQGSGTSTGVVVRGNVYGGGNLADVKTNTEVNMSTGTVKGNVFGGGKGTGENSFTCDKAMVGTEVASNACEDPGSDDNKDKGTKVTISNGTVGTLNGTGENQTLVEGTGNVYGGGEIGRVEWNTQVLIGVGTGNGTFAPEIYGSVFGAGKGLETHGYSALVRGNSTVTIQGNAKIGYNVYGGGEKSTVGRYWVKNIPATLCDDETQPTVPTDLPTGMPYKQRKGGICRVTIQGNAEIGYNGATDEKGHVFGAGKGVNPHFVPSGEEGASQKMVKADANNPDRLEDFTANATTGQTAEEAYLEFLQTLALVTNTYVTIDESAKVKGSVLGGSENGFVQTNTNVTIQGSCEIGTTTYGNVYGGGKGLPTFAEAGKVKGNTTVTINAGAIKGNVYGGGSLGDVGIIDKTDKDQNGKLTYNYFWKQTGGTTPNVDNHNINATVANTGICTVTISGGTIGAEGRSTANHASGHVFGAGKGSEDTWWCEKAIAYATSVTVSGSSTVVYGNVYGGGQVGRVEDDAKVVIGESGASGEGAAPDIKGDVYGAGAGIETHGYSALVRGNAAVSVQGTALVEGSVYGGGEIASVGKFVVVGGLPTKPLTGGTCIVNIKDNAKIGTSGTGHNVFGACKGVTPHYDSSTSTSYKSVYSMQTYENRPSDTPGDTWDYYTTYLPGYQGQKFIKRYYKTEPEYLAFLKTLALTSNPHVTIGGTWTPNETTGTITASGTPTVYGSVYGGGQRGVTLGAVDVNMVGGTVEQDVYGGGALADTNLGNWDVNGYVVVTGLTAGTSSVTGLYTKTETGGKTTYTKITDESATAADGTTYYRQEATWAHAEGSAYYKTTVDLTGGTIKGDAYGGGLGQKIGFNSATSSIEATVWGDIAVNLGSSGSSSATSFWTTYDTDNNGNSVVKSGRVFGCNNLLGSPQGNVTVTVWTTVDGYNANGEPITKTLEANKNSTTDTDHTYRLAAVYGGGNLAPFTATGKKAYVIIHGCSDTSILTVYGGGNAAAVPGTDVDVYSAYEIGALFGGGNGKDKYKNDTGWQINPGANVNGNTDTMIYGGTVHEAYGASNEKGTIYGNVAIDVSGTNPENCPLDVAKLVGAGKNADVFGDLILVMGCKPETKIPLVYGGADNANVNGNVELTITSGNFEKVVGGNNDGGAIKGHIILNIEETTCIPINIDHLYLCGYNAAYSQYGYYVKTTKTEGTPIGDTDETAVLEDGKLQLIPRESIDDPHLPVDTYSYTVNESTGEVEATWTVLPITGNNKFGGYDPPVLNVISCTSIGEVFGGGFGTGATVYGNPTVNINMIPGAHADEITRNGVTGDVNALGEIGDVYGGGDAAAVYGNTTVNIGTVTSVPVYVFDYDDENDAYELHIETVNGKEVPQTTDETVTGAYITGNVYGGGKLADVTGNTFVNVCAEQIAEVNSNNEPTGDFTYNIVNYTGTGYQGVTIGGNVYGGGEGYAKMEEGTAGEAFLCAKAMIGIDGEGIEDSDNNGVADHPDGGTRVVIGNGTVGTTLANGTLKPNTGNVYGGGKVGRVEKNTKVTIGIGNGTGTNAATSTPVIMGNVFGAGAGVNTHGYSALVRGTSTVLVEGDAKVLGSVYGGGEKASVGRYRVDDDGLPVTLNNALAPTSGYCYVTIRGFAEIGPNDMEMTKSGGPSDAGHVFGACQGVLPYQDAANQPIHMDGIRQDDGSWEDKKKTYPAYNAAADLDGNYAKFIKSLALATQTLVTIEGNPFIKGSVYGGSENGYVQKDTRVVISGGQIGNGYVQMDDDGRYLDKLSTPLTPLSVNRRYTADEWSNGALDTTNDRQALKDLVSPNALTTYYTSSLPECASWQYGQAAAAADRYAPYDKYYGNEGYSDSKGGRLVGDDGHTFYGNVFGGGSGYYPYKPGRWFEDAGAVYGNTRIDITGGHILTNIYGGNEMTDIGVVGKENSGKCTVNFGGTATLGVPRTLKQIDAHPVTCYLFGAGKGDQRVFFNKSTNVIDVVVNITGGTIYGSVFGGGEDGHVLRDVTMTIGADGVGNAEPTGPTIGTFGTSYVDGNVFGGGRGFGGDAYTAGNIAGSVEMEIKGGSILGSVYGGGRLGSVGYGLFDAVTNGVTTPGYGEMRKDTDTETGFSTDGFFTNGRGHIGITISGGTIGNSLEYKVPNATNMEEAGIPPADRDISKWNETNKYWDTWREYHNIPKTEFDTTTGQLKHTKGGNVFAGGMGRFYQLDGRTAISAVDWWKLGNVKSTTLNITGGTIKSNVYGGGELGMVQGGTHTSEDNKSVSTEIIINGGTIGTEVKSGNVTQYTFGSVFGGGYGSLVEKFEHQIGNGPKTYSYPKYIAGRVKGSTAVTISGSSTAVMASVYGGGEMAAVGESKVLATQTDPVVPGETLTGDNGTPIVANTYVTISGGTIGKEKVGTTYFGGAKMGNVYGGGSGDNNTVRSGHIYGNTNVTITDGTIYHNVYGGGAYGTVGDFTYDTEYDEDAGAKKVVAISGRHSDRTDTGLATVTITGGIIGIDGKENGMVFGSSRGDINKPEERDDYTAWVYNANVTIGRAATPASGTQEGGDYVAAVPASGPEIKGSVYGSGENGHTFNNTVVTVNYGTIGISSGAEITYTENGISKTKDGPGYPYRGNVYGGGCGTDKYYSNHSLENHSGGGDSYNPLAGIVYGTTTVNINGGTVVRNVYGAGAMGSVGKTTWTKTTTTTTTTEGQEITTTTKTAATTSGGSTTVNINGGTIGTSGTVGDGNVFGAARGAKDIVQADQDDLSRVSVTNVIVSDGEIKGNVYGGGELGDVGTIVKNTSDYNYTWMKSGGNGANAAGNNGITENNTNTGICNVTITGGTIGSTTAGGNVFGGGKGDANTWWCEKAMAFATNVSISEASGSTTVVNGTVYGGGEIGRVEDDSKVIIGTADESDTPDIKGNVFGAGKGMATRGYSALVRGNSIVTVQGSAQVGGSVFGGGEEASLGRFNLDKGLPKSPLSGGYSAVTIQDNATIGSSGTTILTHHVYGAGQGVTPAFDTSNDFKNNRSMQLFENRPKIDKDNYKPENDGWYYYTDDDGKKDDRFVWVYYETEPEYQAFLNTLALASHPTVTIAENATVYGDVYGGGQRGITLGDVAVNITGGTVKRDVYGGGSLADTNKGNWEDKQYVAVTDLPVDHTLTDLYTRTGSGTEQDPYQYAAITTENAMATSGTTYYSKGTWATGKYDATTHATTYKTNVTLSGGEIEGDVYGGGLGDVDVKAKVYGDILVKLNEPVITETTGEGENATTTPTTTYGDCKVHGNIFGCNNLNGSPQSAVTVHVHKTEGWTGHMRTGSDALDDPDDTHHSYELKGVYGGGNLSAYYPDLKATRDTVQAYVIIDGCDKTSIRTVYGGGNAASSPATNVHINACYEIEEVFGGGNGKDDITINGVTRTNPGANVGYEEYPVRYDIPASSKEIRTKMFSYGSGQASVTIYDGLIHRVFGGSNTKGNVRESAVTLLDDQSGCHFQVDEAYGGGKNAPMDAEAKLLMACIPGLKVAYGGAEEADVLGGVTLTITNGTFERVFGGNNISGTIQGPIVVNIEETGCRPIIIGELYGGGNQAGYSVYGYETDRTPKESGTKLYDDPVVNVKSFTSIGNIFGGGFGPTARMIGNPTVNVNVVKGKYSNYVGDPDKYETSGYTYDAKGYKGQTMTIVSGGNQTSVTVPDHEAGNIGAINNVFGGGNEAEVKGTPHVNIGTLTGEVITLASKSIEDSEGRTPSQTGWIPSYQLATVEGVDIRGNVFGGGNEAAVTGDTKVVIGKNDAVKTYSFTSYSAVTGGTEYSTGLAQTTGEVKKVSGTEYAEVVILTNGSYGDYVGKKYYVNKNAKDDGNERAQLMVESESGESLTSTPLYVTIKPFEQKKTYSFTSYGAASEGTQYSTGTAAPTGNFKTFSSTEYMQIVVLTNPDFPEWVGKTFYVPANASTGGTTRTQLYKADGTGAGVWVTITE